LTPDDKPPLDLHESEWSRAGKREPIFGPNAGWFAFYFFGSLIVAPVAHRVAVVVVGAVWPQ
jgi:hypothetical protein